MPTLDVTTLLTKLDSIRADIVSLIDVTETILEASPTVEEHEVVTTSLLGETMPSHDPFSCCWENPP